MLPSPRPSCCPTSPLGNAAGLALAVPRPGAAGARGSARPGHKHTLRTARLTSLPPSPPQRRVAPSLHSSAPGGCETETTVFVVEPCRVLTVPGGAESAEAVLAAF